MISNQSRGFTFASLSVSDSSGGLDMMLSSRSGKRDMRFNSVTLPGFIASISSERKHALSQIVKEIEEAILHDTNTDNRFNSLAISVRARVRSLYFRVWHMMHTTHLGRESAFAIPPEHLASPSIEDALLTGGTGRGWEMGFLYQLTDCLLGDGTDGADDEETESFFFPKGDGSSSKVLGTRAESISQHDTAVGEPTGRIGRRSPFSSTVQSSRASSSSRPLASSAHGALQGAGLGDRESWLQHEGDNMIPLVDIEEEENSTGDALLTRQWTTDSEERQIEGTNEGSLRLSNPIPRRGVSIFSSITQYFVAKSVSPGFQFAQRQPSPMITVSARTTPHLLEDGAHIYGNKSTPDSIDLHRNATPPFLVAGLTESSRTPTPPVQIKVTTFYDTPAHFHSSESNPDTVSPFLSEKPEEGSQYFGGAGAGGAKSPRFALNNTEKKDRLKHLLPAVPCFFTMPIPTKHHSVAEITESIQLYSWVTPYIIACLPPNILHSHMRSLNPYFPLNAERAIAKSNLAKSDTSVLGDRPSTALSHDSVSPDLTRPTSVSPGADGFSPPLPQYAANSNSSQASGSQTNSNSGASYTASGDRERARILKSRGLTLQSWLYLGDFFISKDCTNNSWDLRQLFLCDNFLYESAHQSFRLIGFAPLSHAEIVRTRCHFHADPGSPRGPTSKRAVVTPATATATASASNTSSSLMPALQSPAPYQSFQQAQELAKPKLRKSQSEAAFSLQTQLQILHESHTHLPANSMCLSISCLVDSIEGGPRQTFFIRPDIPDRRVTSSADTASTTAGLDSEFLEQLSALESLVVYASRLGVEDKYSMSFRRADEDYTLLGRGTYHNLFHRFD